MSLRDPKIWMWAEALELLERAERLQRQFFRLALSPARTPSWEPPVDLIETEDKLWIMVALPGVAPEQIQVSVDSGTLVISGERPIPARYRDAHIHRLEIPHGRFERRIELPPGHYGFAEQEMAYGCLLIGLHKH